MRYLDAVAELGCCVCGQPAQIHHARAGSMRYVESAGTGLRTGDDCAIPLCLNHHTGSEGIHTIGVQTFEARYGTQADMLTTVAMLLRNTACEQPRRREKASKVLARCRTSVAKCDT